MNAPTVEIPLQDPRRTARHLYWMGWRVTDIADFLEEKEKTVHSWKTRDEWDRANNVERIGGALEARLVHPSGAEPEPGGAQRRAEEAGQAQRVR